MTPVLKCQTALIASHHHVTLVLKKTELKNTDEVQYSPQNICMKPSIFQHFLIIL